MRFSVALCTYNGERFLREQLDSIAWQTRPPDELIVCDDASMDRTLAIVRAFARAVPFAVRILVNEYRLGSSKNFDRAISECDGDIIVLSDQDDVWVDDKLAVVERLFNTFPDTDLVFSDAEVVDEALRPQGYRLWDAIKFPPKERRDVESGHAIRAVLRHNVVTGATMAFRARLRSLLLPVPAQGIHDAWIALLVAATGRLRTIPRPLILYRQHGGNQIGARGLDLVERLQGPSERSIIEARNTLLQYEQATARLRDRASAGVTPALLEDLMRKIEHLRCRINVALREPGWSRLMLSEIIHGRYHRYSVGWLSVGHDLIKRGLSRRRAGRDGCGR